MQNNKKWNQKELDWVNAWAFIIESTDEGPSIESACKCIASETGRTYQACRAALQKKRKLQDHLTSRAARYANEIKDALRRPHVEMAQREDRARGAFRKQWERMETEMECGVTLKRFGELVEMIEKSMVFPPKARANSNYSLGGVRLWFALPKCKHRKSWIVCGGHLEWCYQCGAIRQLVKTGPAASTVGGPWTCPTGVDGDNPATSEAKKMDQWRKRHGIQK